MNKRWTLKELPTEKQVEALCLAININPTLASILVQRGISDFESAKDYFRPSLQHLHNPFLMKGMERAVTRLRKAIDLNEKILIYGDYDVDGPLLSRLSSLSEQILFHGEIYVPDRYAEGYGVSLAGIEYAEQHGFTLIIALDCGIKSSELVEVAKLKGIDFIICDHHLPDENIPNAVAVLDPKQENCEYPYHELSGCGLGFKFMQGYAQKYRDEKELYEYLDLVAVSIASDIVPITGENRVLTYFGLKKLNENPSAGFKALRDIAGIKSDLDVSGVVFSLGPRINAAGRVAHARGAVQLLVAKSESEANELAERLNLKNDIRKQFDSDITVEALSMIESNDVLRSAKSTVLFKNTWHRALSE